MSVLSRCTDLGRLSVRRGISAGSRAASFAREGVLGRRVCGPSLPRLAAFAPVVQRVCISTLTCFWSRLLRVL